MLWCCDGAIFEAKDRRDATQMDQIKIGRRDAKT